MVLFAAIAASSQLRLERLLTSLIINRLLLPIPNLNRPVKMVPSIVTEVRRAVLKLTDSPAGVDARINDSRVAAANVDARLAALVAFESFGLARASLLPVGAEPEWLGRLDCLACCFGAGRVDVVFDFLVNVARVAVTVEGVEADVIGVAGAVAAESLEEAAVWWGGTGVGELRAGEGADHGWNDGWNGRHGGKCLASC